MVNQERNDERNEMLQPLSSAATLISFYLGTNVVRNYKEPKQFWLIIKGHRGQIEVKGDPRAERRGEGNGATPNLWHRNQKAIFDP